MIGPSNAQWASYRNTLNEFSKSAAQKEITFLRYKRSPSAFKEDLESNDYESRVITCLINYNYLRTWPATKSTEAGELDRDSMQVLFNKEYLKGIGLLTADGNLDYNPDYDRFVVDGQLKKAMGDTAAAQAGNTDVLYTIILKNEEIETGQNQVR